MSTDSTEMFVREVEPDAKSIVDNILDLDDFLAKDVRRALKQAAWFTRPELEADIEQLNSELDQLTDGQGRPLPEIDATLERGRNARVVAMELQAVQKAYAASRRVILMQQIDEDDWTEFQNRWKEALDGEPPYPAEFYEDLISRSAHKPKITPEQVAQLRKKVGRAVWDEIWKAAWQVNTMSGVSIPKSWISSSVLRQPQHD